MIESFSGPLFYLLYILVTACCVSIDFRTDRAKSSESGRARKKPKEKGKGVPAASVRKAGYMDEGDPFGTARVGAKCGRWNPTAEQVKVLTDLFRSGLRTPSTDQIQTISSHLSSFGKIESKNVFYWFQNHKARERHHKKRRRAGPGPGPGPGGGDDHLVLVPEKRGARTRSLPSNDSKNITHFWNRQNFT